MGRGAGAGAPNPPNAQRRHVHVQGAASMRLGQRKGKGSHAHGTGTPMGDTCLYGLEPRSSSATSMVKKGSSGGVHALLTSTTDTRPSWS
jgi:hypothetical protein